MSTGSPLPRTPAGLVLPAPLWDELVAAYRAPGRFYHDATHLDEVIERFFEVPSWQQPRELFLALLFHDAGYVAGATDNEARSAALARTAIARFLPEATLAVDRVEQLIALTARHGALAAATLDLDAAQFVDCDLAILGSPPARFAAYEAGIAREYAALPRELYREGRRRFLERLLAAPRIFFSPYFYDRLEAAARENLQRSLGR